MCPGADPNAKPRQQACEDALLVDRQLQRPEKPSWSGLAASQAGLVGRIRPWRVFLLACLHHLSFNPSGARVWVSL